MVDESVIGYSADGKDRPGHPCTYSCPASFFLSFSTQHAPTSGFLIHQGLVSDNSAVDLLEVIFNTSHALMTGLQHD